VADAREGALAWLLPPKSAKTNEKFHELAIGKAFPPIPHTKSCWIVKPA